jgi:hypothetical protein
MTRETGVRTHYLIITFSPPAFSFTSAFRRFEHEHCHVGVHEHALGFELA